MAPLMVLWLALAPGSVAPADDPLAPAWAGQVQCYAPDVQRRTCVSIGAYARNGGEIRNTATVLVAAQPVIVMRATATVQVKGDAVCGVILARDIEAAEFTVDGAPAAADDAQSIRRGMAPAYQQVLNREVCTTYPTAGDGQKAVVRVDGQRRPDLDMPVRWISPGDGFEVKP